MRSTSSLLLFVILILSIILPACNKEKQVDPDLYIPDEADVAELLFFNSVGFGANSKFTDTTMIVIQSASEWKELQQNVPIPIDYPAINFDQRQVLVVAVPTTEGGRSLTVDTIEKSDSIWIANILVNEPDTGCITTTALGSVSPFIVAYTAKTQIKFKLNLASELYPCPELTFKN